jgi:hypothetical protein
MSRTRWAGKVELMKKPKKPALTLATETIRRLTALTKPELQQVNGGLSRTCSSDACL